MGHLFMVYGLFEAVCANYKYFNDLVICDVLTNNVCDSDQRSNMHFKAKEYNFLHYVNALLRNVT